MSCPFFDPTKSGTEINNGEISHSEDNEDITYSSYLQMDKLLDCQLLRSELPGSTPHHDEHLFIITHQAFELWFKQILHEIDSVRKLFNAPYLEERNMLTIIRRLNRISAILKLCTEKFSILETMTSQDFLEMREYLNTSSGFQSLQFRLIEIKLGVKDILRINHNGRHFKEFFTGNARNQLDVALQEPSLLDVLDTWLRRTPGINGSFRFWNKFELNVHDMLKTMKAEAGAEKDPEMRKKATDAIERRRKKFDSLLDVNQHNELLKSGERRFTHFALRGAVMIFCYRDEPRFHLPFQVLQSLTDIDNQLMKWRYNHSCMVQRMIGSMSGTGGSQGYHYLRSTCSDRYKIFPDLLNMATFLIPRQWIPPLSVQMKRCLSLNEQDDSGCSGDNDSCI